MAAMDGSNLHDPPRNRDRRKDVRIVTEPGIAARLRARLHTPKPSVRRNVVANFVATGWAAILGIVVVPLNVRFIGIEGYAVIGVYAMVQALSLLLDSGLSPTLNRELAQRSAAGHSASDTRTLVRTLEIVYWGVALLVGLIVVGLAPIAARYWLHPERLSVSEVQRALMLMGLTIAIQWPASFYASGVQGLQRQVEPLHAAMPNVKQEQLKRYKRYAIFNFLFNLHFRHVKF